MIMRLKRVHLYQLLMDRVLLVLYRLQIVLPKDPILSLQAPRCYDDMMAIAGQSHIDKANYVARG